MQTLRQELLITEDKFIPPLIEVLDKVTPKIDNVQPRPKDSFKSTKDSLDTLFPEQQYDEKNIQKAKEILGTSANQFSSEQLKDVVTEIQFLVTSWLDDFERDAFDGLTLQELLHEKGRL